MEITPRGSRSAGLQVGDLKPNDTTMRGINVKAARGAREFRDSVNGVYKKKAGSPAPTLAFK